MDGLSNFRLVINGYSIEMGDPFLAYQGKENRVRGKKRLFLGVSTKVETCG